MTPDDAKGMILGLIAQGVLPSVQEALERLRDAKTEGGAVQVIWDTLATAAAQRDAVWCREFIGGVPTDRPRSVVLGMYLTTYPLAEELREERDVLAKRCEELAKAKV